MQVNMITLSIMKVVKVVVSDGDGDGDIDGEKSFFRNPIEKLLSVYRVMQDPKVCLIKS